MKYHYRAEASSPGVKVTGVLNYEAFFNITYKRLNDDPKSMEMMKKQLAMTVLEKIVADLKEQTLDEIAKLSRGGQ